jgi:hypothetical protein
VYYGTYIAIAILVLKIILLIITLLALYGVAKGILPKTEKEIQKGESVPNNLPRSAYRKSNRLLILLLQAEKAINKF